MKFELKSVAGKSILFVMAAETDRMAAVLEDAERARKRLALDEFIELQKQIQQRRKTFESRAQALPCGHYLSEEAPEETYRAMRDFFVSKT